MTEKFSNLWVGTEQTLGSCTASLKVGVSHNGDIDDFKAKSREFYAACEELVQEFVRQSQQKLLKMDGYAEKEAKKPVEPKSKPKKETSSGRAQIETDSESKPKKKRGRPRKVAEDTTEEVSSVVEAVEKTREASQKALRNTLFGYVLAKYPEAIKLKAEADEIGGDKGDKLKAQVVGDYLKPGLKASFGISLSEVLDYSNEQLIALLESVGIEL